MRIHSSKLCCPGVTNPLTRGNLRRLYETEKPANLQTYSSNKHKHPQEYLPHNATWAYQAAMHIYSSNFCCPGVSGPSSKGQPAPRIMQQKRLPKCKHNLLVYIRVPKKPAAQYNLGAYAAGQVQPRSYLPNAKCH
jgi:hypothetical protein